nr:hypothetical protein [Tanacetum cinerariifolium]
SFEPSNDNTNVVNAPREPFVVTQINHHCCYGCGDPLEGIFCRQCTCELCGNGAHHGYNCPLKIPIIPNLEPFKNQTIKELPPTVQSFDPKSDLVHNSPNIFDPPPQLPFYYCEFCGNDARYGHYCTSQVPFVYPEPCYNEDFNFFQDFQQQDLCCENCEEEEKQIEEEQAANARYWKIPACYDFADELTLLKSIPPEIDETDCDPEEETHFIKRLLYDNSSPLPPKEFVSRNSDAEIESFSPSLIPVEDNNSLMEEIDLSFTPDYPMPLGIEDDDYDSKSDMLILEELLSNDSLSLPENESFHFDIPSSFRPSAKPPDGNTRILNVKMTGHVSEQKVPMPRLVITLVPNQEKSPDLLSHLGLETFWPSAECPMMIHGKNTPILDVPLFHFYPP